MINQMGLVGRLVSDPQINETEIGNKICSITLAVPRSYKNANGEYETDFIPVILFNGIAERTTEWCKKGDLVGVKGRIQAKEGKVELMAEKITFLSSNKEN